MCAQRHWFLIELQLPSFKVVVYDSLVGHLPTKVLEMLVLKKLRDHLPTYLDMIRYWEMSGNKKPKKLHFTFEREKGVPQQAQMDEVYRGDCGAFVCMFLEQMCIKQQKLALPERTPTSALAGLAYRHLMAACIYISRLLPPNFNDPW
jgi:Ulp1 family protease